MSTYPELLDQAHAEGPSLVTLERHEDRAVVTLADPLRLNSLSARLVLQLRGLLAELAIDNELRSIVITGQDPAFSAGGDLEMIEAGSNAIRDATKPADTTDAWRWIRRQFGGLVRTIAATDKVFIAAMNGPAAGVGLAVAFACDVIIASERAELIPAFGRLGLVPEVGTSWLLTRRLGYHGALALYISGRHIDAQEALQLGLVQELCPHGELRGVVNRWCDRVTRFPPHAIEMTKPLLRASADASWEQSLALEEFAEANCFSTANLPRAAAEIRASR